MANYKLSPNAADNLHRNQNIYFRVQGEVIEMMAILGRQDAQTWLLPSDSES